MMLVALRGVTERADADLRGIEGHVKRVIEAAGYRPKYPPNITVETDKGAPYGVHWVVVFEVEE